MRPGSIIASSQWRLVSLQLSELVFEAEDFGAEFTPELREQEERLRAEIEKNQAR